MQIGKRNVDTDKRKMAGVRAQKTIRYTWNTISEKSAQPKKLVVLYKVIAKSSARAEK